MRQCVAALLAAVVAVAVACGPDDGRARHESGAPVVVDVAATTCDRPLPRHGVGTVVGPDVVLTARHVVEGPLRHLVVDGRVGEVVHEDPRLDLALVSVAGLAPTGVPPVWSDPGTVTRAAIIGPEATRSIGVDRTVRLTVVDHTDGTEFERRSHVLDRAVPAGSSGSPIVAGAEVVGVVTLAVPGAEESHAVTAAEIERFLTRVQDDRGMVRDTASSRTC